MIWGLGWIFVFGLILLVVSDLSLSGILGRIFRSLIFFCLGAVIGCWGVIMMIVFGCWLVFFVGIGIGIDVIGVLSFVLLTIIKELVVVIGWLVFVIVVFMIVWVGEVIMLWLFIMFDVGFRIDWFMVLGGRIMIWLLVGVSGEI